MKKATKRKIILSGILFHMILVFTACGLCNKATFIGDEISDTDFYDILVVTEEKWLRDLYGKQYEDYCNRVNRCIPWFRNKVL